jgi:hypothetical protein
LLLLSLVGDQVFQETDPTAECSTTVAACGSETVPVEVTGKKQSLINQFDLLKAEAFSIRAPHFVGRANQRCGETLE